jgi:oxaloacetate decarboxylase alpha subunit
VLIYAQFPQIGLKFLENRNNPDAFEPAPSIEAAAPAATVAPAASPAPVPASGTSEAYNISVNGQSYHVVVSPEGTVQQVVQAPSPMAATPVAPVAPSGASMDIPAPLAGNIFNVNVTVGQQISQGDVIMVLEAMKMETEVRSSESGTVSAILVKEGDAVQVGEALLRLN